MIERLDDRRVVVCAGAGGVGKTTVSAALALGLAAAGQRVAVITIDPARRLANALGLEELGNDPQRVDGRRLAGHGLEIEGELWAMTLDPKRTFDDLVVRLAPDASAQGDVLSNPIYQRLSSAVAGAQEYTAVSKVYDLHHDERFDVIVVDTPPSRNALDFLDAPARLIAFLESGVPRAFLAPSGIAARVAARGTGAVLGVLRRVTGVEVLEDLAAFFRALGTLLDGFRERATGVQALLADPSTAFIVVASTEHEPVEEAIHLGAALAAAGLPFAGLVVNRVHAPANGDADLADPELQAKVAATVAEVDVLATRDAAAITRLQAALGDADPAIVPHLDHDVHDVDGLVAVWGHL